MHELGVLKTALGRVQKAADDANILHIKTVTLEVGRSSNFVPEYFFKLYPAAREFYPATASSELKIDMVDGGGLVIKEIAY
ncbi:MAG: hydrogenase maturation nickel metallochaperone HypA [Clostridia bacterium]|nr:hydrogenase maturation nickel metallochaperone HypA [Clostridia bacterium]MBR4954837.1 hydrogenase maturation nickel metallochaperone HypA [Clostridia bacterium]MBR5903014.1 hydrogenase maturation nickel metallochaperone HypA [Clostridia bacterium]